MQLSYLVWLYLMVNGSIFNGYSQRMFGLIGKNFDTVADDGGCGSLCVPLRNVYILEWNQTVCKA